jgi:hypothetical protein
MKKSTLLFTLLSIVLSAAAQKKDATKIVADTVKHWKKGGITTLNFSQSSFTNWAAGGENAVSGTALVSLFACYKDTNNIWDNSINLGYGLLQSGTAGIRKNEDKIDISSTYGRYAFYKHWYYSALVNFKSQFTNGYNYPDDSTVVSRFMSPGYLTGAIGLEYKTSDNSFSFFVSPLTSKTTFVNDQQLANTGAYGVQAAKYDTVGGVYVIVQKGKTILDQFGGYIRLTYKKDIMKNVNLNTKVEVFSNYLKNPQDLYVNWELLLAMKINKFLVSSISTQMLYDQNIPIPVERTIDGVKVKGTGPRLQFKEVLAIGLSYKF